MALVSVLRTVASGAPPFDPTAYGTVLAWYKGGGLALSEGAAVASWPDSSGNGHPLNTASGSPIFHASLAALGNNPGVTFNGSNYIYGALDGTALTALTFFGVFVDQGTGGASLQWAQAIHSASPFFLISRNGATNDLYVDNAFNLPGIAGAVGTAYLYALVTDGAVWNIYVNGTLAGTHTGGFGHVPNALQLWLGSGYNTETAVDWGEVLIYSNPLNTTNRQAVETALRAKYGL